MSMSYVEGHIRYNNTASRDIPEWYITKIEKEPKLDGCYVLKTALTPAQAKKELVHDRYKDLASVAHAFRTCKTAHLEVRPIFLRLEARTRAHAFVVMLAYQIIQ